MNLTQRQNYYESLVAFGMPEIIAASMAAQCTNCIVFGELHDLIYGFADWTKTKEGAEFWLWLYFDLDNEVQTL